MLCTSSVRGVRKVFSAFHVKVLCFFIQAYYSFADYGVLPRFAKNKVGMEHKPSDHFPCAFGQCDRGQSPNHNLALLCCLAGLGETCARATYDVHSSFSSRCQSIFFACFSVAGPDEHVQMVLPILMPTLLVLVLLGGGYVFWR